MQLAPSGRLCRLGRGPQPVQGQRTFERLHVDQDAGLEAVEQRVGLVGLEDDGLRVLVDRLWPRGISKERARIDLWLKELAPSNELRRWYGHQPERWEGFKERYFRELNGVPEAVERLRSLVAEGPVTFVFSSKEERLNNAEALKIYLESAAGGRHGTFKGAVR